MSESECRVVIARMAALGFVIETSGGNCPVQIEGMLNGLAVYFRARGAQWSVEIDHRGEDWYY